MPSKGLIDDVIDDLIDDVIDDDWWVDLGGPGAHHQSGHLKAFEILFDEHRQTQTDTDRQQGFGAKLRVHTSKTL